MTVLKHRIELGDMQALYYLDETSGNMELVLIPVGMEPLSFAEKHKNIDSLVQLKYTRDTYLGAYAGGRTLRQSESVEKLRYQGQKQVSFTEREEIITKLTDERGYQAAHHLVWYHDSHSVECYTVFANHSKSPVTLELLSSFSLGGLTPFVEEDAHDSLLVHRIQGVWSMEGRVRTDTAEDLQLEPSWGGHAVRCERFGQTGSMPVNQYFPFLAVEDKKSGVIWGMQLAHNASWQMELFRRDNSLAVSGGLADRDFGQWMKNIAVGEEFTTPRAILSVCSDKGFCQAEREQGAYAALNHIAQRMTRAGMRFFKQAPASEQELPIIFNEYCTTWGCPSHENISSILEAIRGKGFSYFVIDCGWFKEDGIPWDISMGDYEVSPTLFPTGLQTTVDAIRAEGLQPGIWFEIDNVGSASHAYQMEEHLLKKDGRVLTTTMRRFWNMQDTWVEKYLTERVIDTLRRYGFTYMKMDYNDSIGAGCDGAESLGEGLRQNMEASLAFIEKVKRDVPGIVLENCASGGHKLEPLMMSACSMASFSDAHECEEIPIIAAQLHRVILPCQSQIWAVIRETDSLKRIAYSVANTFLGRMCLSGDVCNLSREQWDVIEKGIAFYQKAAPVIRDGISWIYGPKITSWRHPQGWQAVVRHVEDGRCMVVIHTFAGELPQRIEITLPEAVHGDIQEVYVDIPARIHVKQGRLEYEPARNWCAVAVLL